MSRKSGIIGLSNPGNRLTSAVFNMLIGHARIWNFLIRSAERDKLAHAYLFTGPAQVGKLTLAQELAKWLFCEKRSAAGQACSQCRACRSVERGENPDLTIIPARQADKDGILKNAEIGIKEIRDLQSRLSLSPYGASHKIVIIEEVAGLSGEAASALLKTLEEPSPRSLIILISSSWQAVLPTIISRCQMIKFLSVPEKEMTARLKASAGKEADLRRAIKLAAGRPGRAIGFLREAAQLAAQREKIDNFKIILKSSLAGRWEQAQKMSQDAVSAQESLELWLLWLRDRILEQNGQPALITGEAEKEPSSAGAASWRWLDACREIQKTRAILNNPSFNARLALEVLMTKI